MISITLVFCVIVVVIGVSLIFHRRKYHPPLSVEVYSNPVQSSLSFSEFSKLSNFIISFIGCFNRSDFFQLNPDLNTLVDEFYSF